MIKTLGIDPGSKKIGINILEYSNQKINLINSWQIPLYGAEKSHRLFCLGEELEKIIKQYSDIHSIGLEETFISSDTVKNKDGEDRWRYSSDSPLVLSMSRGVVHYIGGKYNIPVFEYSNQAAKKQLTGVTTATKKMVTRAAKERFKRDFGEDESCSIAVNLIHILTMIEINKLNQRKI
jgi:crossover junction endodeoxyribonuclease RuvC